MSSPCDWGRVEIDLNDQMEFVPLSTNALMKHIRASGIEIGGSSAKKKLQNVGYYHGYKGYRFARERRNLLPITDFSQILNLYAFDMEMKSLFYPRIMQIETSLKSCILDAICSKLSEKKLPASYDVVCSTCLTGAGAKEQYRELSFLAGKISRLSAQEGDPVIRHFTDGGRGVPIWALLETLTLGEFSAIYSCLTEGLKSSIYKRLDLPARSDDPKAHKKDRTDILLALLRVLASLRNSVAHNNVVLDARFLIRNEPNKYVKEYLGSEFGVGTVPFNCIADCMLLTVFFMTALGYSKTERKRFVAEYERVLDSYYDESKVPPAIFHQMVGKSDSLKIKAAQKYISRR